MFKLVIVLVLPAIVLLGLVSLLVFRTVNLEIPCGPAADALDCQHQKEHPDVARLLGFRLRLRGRL